MGNLSIYTTKLKTVACEAGNILHVLKKDETSFSSFGEAYFSWINASEIKGWKKHLKMTSNLVVPIGTVKFVIYDSNHKLITEESVGESNYVRLTIPPNYWFAFQGLSTKPSLILNIANIKHSEEEIERLPLNSFKFPWVKQ